MFKKLLDLFFKNPRQRRIDKQTLWYQGLVKDIETKSQIYSELSDDELKDKIQQNIEYYKNLDDSQREIDVKNLNTDEVIETFALIREMAYRILGLRHYPVQLMGGLALSQQLIAEMQTGEGKTITAALASIYYALKTQKQVHIVTANSYLAERDALQLAPLYKSFGLTCSNNPEIKHKSELKKKYDIFKSQIIYSGAHDLVNDYLYSSIQNNPDDVFLHSDSLNFVIIDEADFVLLDSAKESVVLATDVPFDGKYLSWAHKTAKSLLRSSNDYQTKNKFMTQASNVNMDLSQDDVDELIAKKAEINDDSILEYDEMGNPIDGHFFIYEVSREINLFESAYEIIHQSYREQFKKEIDENPLEYPHIILAVQNAINAQHLLMLNRDYINQDGHIIMMNLATGRPLPISRWEGGLHQAVEYKEGVEIQNDSKILASITYQSFFNQYQYKSGMTGTAQAEQDELDKTYGLIVFPIPTNKPNIRIDHEAIMFIDDETMFTHISEVIKERMERGQPILIGTGTLNVSEQLSQYLTKLNIPHNLLNANHLKNEAKIIAEAGRPATVTISTNMAGRGTDIILGGDINSKIAELDYLLKTKQINQSAYDKRFTKLNETWHKDNQTVIENGGLLVIAVGLNSTRRVAAQLLGRCGRQGDVGETMTVYSLEDVILSATTSSKSLSLMRGQMERMGVTDTTQIPHQYNFINWSKISKKAQMALENHIAKQRQNSLRYESIQNQQRLQFNKMRDNIIHMQEEDLFELFDEYAEDFIKHELHEKMKLKGLLHNGVDSYDLLTNKEMVLLVSEVLHEVNLTTQQSVQGAGEEIINQFKENYDNEADENQNIDILMKGVVVLKGIFHLRWQTILLLEDKGIQIDFIRKVFLNALNEMWYSYIGAMEVLQLSAQLAVYAKKEPFYEFSQNSHKQFMSILENYPHQAMKELFNEPMIDKIDVENILKYLQDNNVDASSPQAIMQALDKNIAPALFQNEVLSALVDLPINTSNKK